MLLLYVCLLITWLCIFDLRQQLTFSVEEFLFCIDGGRVLMAITNTLMVVQAGFPTGVCVVRSRRAIHGKGQG